MAVATTTLSWTRHIGTAAFWLPELFVARYVAYALGTFKGLLHNFVTANARKE
jgi:hypothetical protein